MCRKQPCQPYLKHDVGVQHHHAEVVDDHGRFEVEGLAVGHQPRAGVHREDDVAQQDGRHLQGILHERVVSDSGIWKTR